MRVALLKFYRLFRTTVTVLSTCGGVKYEIRREWNQIPVLLHTRFDPGRDVIAQLGQRLFPGRGLTAGILRRL